MPDTFPKILKITRLVGAGMLKEELLQIYSPVSGTNTYTATLDPPHTYVEGDFITLRFQFANTTAATFNSYPIVANDGVTPLSGGEITNDMIATLEFDGTSFRMPASGGGGSSVKINSTPVSDPDFNGTTPAAPGGGFNILWQHVGSNVSAYIPANTYDTFGAAGTAQSNAEGYADSQITARAVLLAPTGDQTITNAHKLILTGTLQLEDPADNTKIAHFDLSNIIGGNDRAVNIPNANSTTIQPFGAVSQQFVKSISSQGLVAVAQPAFSDLSGSIVVTQTPLSTLGDILFVDTAPALQRLAGNITAVRNFLRQTGTGSTSAAPAWDTLIAGDIPNPAGDVTGTYAATVVSRLQTRDMSNSAPNVNDIIAWSGTTWTPTAISAVPNANASEIQGVAVATTTPIHDDQFTYSEIATDWAVFERPWRMGGWNASSSLSAGVVALATWGLATGAWVSGSSITTTAPSATEPLYTTGNVTISGSSTGLTSQGFTPIQRVRRFRARVLLPTTATSMRAWIGLGDTNTGGVWRSDQPNQNFVGFRYSTSASDAKWTAVIQTGSGVGAQTTGTTAGEPAIDNTGHDLMFAFDGTNVRFYVDSLKIATLGGANLPADTVVLNVVMLGDSAGVSTPRSISLAHYGVEMNL